MGLIKGEKRVCLMVCGMFWATFFPGKIQRLIGETTKRSDYFLTLVHPPIYCRSCSGKASMVSHSVNHDVKFLEQKLSMIFPLPSGKLT